SIVQFCNYKRALVWVSGIINSDSEIPDAKYLAVRGYETVKRIEELGSSPPKAIGDPAILLPRLYKPKKAKRYKVGVIPHYAHYEYIKSEISQKNSLLIINLLDDVEDIINKISQCDLTITTSLHTLIVSHAYGIKSIWSQLTEFSLSGDNVKFVDYFSSVDIKPYKPLDLDCLTKGSRSELIKKINKEYSSVLLPDQKRLKSVQKRLIKTFPFRLKEKYQALV